MGLGTKHLGRQLGRRSRGSKCFLQIHGRFEVMETDAFYACVIDSRTQQKANFTAANEGLKNRRFCVDEAGNSSVALAVQMLIEAVELAE
jgi:hypothetical protein